MAAANRDSAALSVLGVSVTPFRRADAVAFLEDSIAKGVPTRVAFANVNLLNIAYKDPGLRALLATFLVLNDGVGVTLASRWLYGARFPDNLNGTDFCPEFLEKCRFPLRIYLLGGRPSTVSEAAGTIAGRWPRHEVVGVHHGYFVESEIPSIRAQIASARADLVFVAMGNGLQERVIGELVPACAACAWGVGAWFDFLTGRIPRAPRLLRRVGAEWAYRLMQEPRRLWKRYVIGNPVFLWRVFRERLGAA
jgi:exopolysaccharide biosynthesis WecB/TagA/CpsF family protein